MERDPERVRRLDAEVRGLIEDLRLARDARRDAPSQLPLTHPEDTVYYDDDEQELDRDVADAPGGSAQPADQYARTPRLVAEPPSAYQRAPAFDEAPKIAERKPQAAKATPTPTPAPAPKRFAKLRELFGEKRAEQNASRPFEDRPLPAPSASPKEQRAYLDAAARAGYDIKPDDLANVLGRLDAMGEAGTIEDHVFAKHTGGEGALTEILMRQRPQLAEAARFANRAADDAQEPFVRQYAKDFNATNVLADEARFDAAMGRVAQMKPLDATAGYERFTEARLALRDIGVRVTVKDFEQFKKDVKQEWTADVMREGKSLGTQALLDMTLPPASRQLIGSDARRWDTVLRANQQFPELAERRELLRQQAAEPVNPTLANSHLPPTPPKMVRDGVERPVPPGYSQEGKIVKIDERNRAVWQATRAAGGPGENVDAVRYDLAEISRAIPLDDLKTAMERGHNVSVSLKDGAYDVVDRDWVPHFELGDLDRAAANLEDPQQLLALSQQTEAVEIER